MAYVWLCEWTGIDILDFQNGRVQELNKADTIESSSIISNLNGDMST